LDGLGRNFHPACRPLDGDRLLRAGLHSDHVERPQHPSGDAFLLTEQSEQEVLGADVVALKLTRLDLRHLHDLARLLRESLEQALMIAPRSGSGKKKHAAHAPCCCFKPMAIMSGPRGEPELVAAAMLVDGRRTASKGRCAVSSSHRFPTLSSGPNRSSLSLGA
jgi:hypothetical protein